MTAYTGRRLLHMIPVLVAVITLVFLMLHVIPGDPARLMLGPEATEADIAKQRSILGLDRPVHEQYIRFATGLLTGNMGTSFVTGRPVLSEAIPRFGRTLQLSVAALTISSILGILVGVPAGARPYSTTSALTMLLALVGVSMPTFWLGLLLMLIFSLRLDLLPSAGTGTWKHMVLPTVTLGVFSLGVVARMTRASVAEVVRKDYIRTARAKGLSERVVILKHALRNALIPVVTVMGLRFGYMLGGAVATETVFNWPGLGRFIVESILTRDYPAVQAGILLFSVSFLFVNLLVDLTYAFIDPRISYS